MLWKDIVEPQKMDVLKWVNLHTTKVEIKEIYV